MVSMTQPVGKECVVFLFILDLLGQLELGVANARFQLHHPWLVPDVDFLSSRLYRFELIDEHLSVFLAILEMLTQPASLLDQVIPASSLAVILLDDTLLG